MGFWDTVDTSKIQGYTGSKKKKEGEDIAPVITSGGSDLSGGFWDTVDRSKIRSSGDISPVSSVSSRIASRMTTKDEEKDDKKAWFQKGLFEDGYDFGDITKTILGSTGDVLENLGSGVMGMGEKAVDALAYLAPAFNNANQAQNNPAYQFDIKEYRKQQGYMSDFIQKDLYDEEAIAKAVISAPLEKGLNVDTETDSVFGEKSDALVQSGGQLLGTIGLQAVGVPWWVTSATTSFGTETENALRQGASYEKAGASAAISAGAEVLTEKLFGGSGLGEKGLINTDLLTRGISNKLVKSLADYGVDIASEGFEEVASEIASNLGSSLYREENLKDILLSEEALEGYVDSFIGGGVLGGVMNASKFVGSAKDGTDYRSDFTQNEQMVVDKVYNDRLAEAEKNGKVSARDKAKIHESVKRDMEKGYISTDTIEEVLGGESYRTYKNFTDTENAILKEFEELENKANPTIKDHNRYHELLEKVNEIKSDNFASELKSKLSDEVFNLAKGDRLVESYNEKARRGQAFEADLTQYDTKQQAVVQKAIESGVLNNTNRTHELVDMVAKISADKGVLFDFTNNENLKNSGFAVDGKFVNGYVTKDGITLNVNSAKALNSIVGHEITHVLEGTEIYNELQNTLVEYAKSKGEYDNRFASLQELYKDIKDADINKELTADLVGDYLFTDENFINNLSANNRNVFQKIYDEIKYLCKVATAGSKEARELEKVKRAFDKAYRENGKAQTDTKYSLSDTDGKQLTQEQQDYFKDSKLRDENGNLKVMYHGSQDAGFHEFIGDRSDDGISFFFTDRNDVASSYSGTTETYEARTIRTAEDMNNFLAEIGEDEDYNVVEKGGKFELFQDGDSVATSDTAQGIYEEFCDWAGVGYGDANYKVYLNLKNPLVVDAEGRNWDNISREFSQEIYDKYQSLTAEEKATLHDLAGWGEFSEFKSEITSSWSKSQWKAMNHNAVEGDDYTKNLASVYDKLIYDDTVSMYDLFSISEDNFSEESLKNFAVKQLKTRDYAQRAKEQGYDGVIINNVVDIGGYGLDGDGKSTVAIAFESNQIKSTANAKPTGKADIRYSLSEDTTGRKLSENQKEYFKDSKVVDENGKLKVMYHGTPNGDFTVFKDGTYFTDSKEYADVYQSPSASSISTGKVASNPKTFEVYLDIKKPFDISDAEARNIYINDYIKGGNAIGINPYMSDAEYGKIQTIDWTEGEDLRDFLIENEYGYDGLVLDEGGVGGYGEEVQSRGKSYVVFSPEQVKNIDNQNPTAAPDIRFSLSKTVEETKDLLAIHNLTEGKLLKSLQLGGMAMPSIAVTKDYGSNSDFGEISLVLTKDAIDPKASRNNKLYSGDAWTPTYPAVEYKLNEKVNKKIRAKIESLVPYEIGDGLDRIGLDTDNMTDTLNRYNGDMVEAFKRNYTLKYAYLKEAGSDITLPMKEKNLSYSGRRDNGAIIKVAEKIPAEELQKARKGGYDAMQQIEPSVREAVAEYIQETYKDNPEIIELLAPSEELSYSDLDGYVTEALGYLRHGVQKTVDTKLAKRDIDDRTVQYSYENWLKELFSGIVEKEGIRNNKDYFTPSGNRRSFEALHYEHNLENVVKAMREKGDKGIGGFGGGNIFGSATTEFSSIEDMKKSSDRLKNLSEEEYQEIKDGFSNRFFEIAQSLPNNKNSFSATDDAANTLTEAVAKYNTRSGIANYLKRELKGWATYSEQAVDDLIQLVSEIRNTPTSYFEAKPRRAVGFDEVAAFVIPYDADVKLKQELLNQGYSIAEYDPKVEGDRQRVLNSFEEYKFSLSNVGEEQKTYGNYNIYGKDVSLETAPVAEAAPEVNVEAPVKDDISEMFPDEQYSPEDELKQLNTAKENLEAQMRVMADTNDYSKFEEVMDEYANVIEKLDALEAEATERADSLGDADVPPEIDAPIYQQQEVTADDPFYDREIADVGKRNVKAYMYENPEVKPFFQDAALGMLGDLREGIKGEKWYNDELYYASGGEKGFGGTKRQTTDDIAELLDNWHYTYAQIEKGLNAIIEDHGAENNAVSKRIEFMLNDRLLNGYTSVWGEVIPADQGYINLLNEKQINEYSTDAFNSFMENAERYIPPEEDIAPVSQNLTKEANVEAPVQEDSTYRKKFRSDGEYRNPNVNEKTFTQNKPKNPNVAKILDSVPDTPAKRRSRMWAKFVANVVDKGAVFENIALKKHNRELIAKWNRTLTVENEAQRLIGHGTDNVKSLNSIRDEVMKSGKTKQFYTYLYHKHNIDRMTLLERFGVENKSVFGETVDANFSRNAVAGIEKTNPVFKKWAKDVYKYNSVLRDLLVENDVISKETADLWEKMYPHYVPIRRVGDEGLNINVPLDSNHTGVNAPVKRATGGSSDILPLFDTMAQRTLQTYKAIAKNDFGIELKNVLGSVVGSDVATIDDAIDGVDFQDGLLKEGVNGGNPTFTVFENGERVTFEITPDMYEAFKPASGLLTETIKPLNFASNTFRNLVTQYNPTFTLTNAIKDAQDVLLNSQHPLRTYAKIPEAYAQIVGGKLGADTYWYKEYAENGGINERFYDSKKNRFVEKDNVLTGAIKLPLKAIETVNDIIETAPRLAEYIASREAGRSVEVSMLDAARVTTNFAAGGDLTKFLNRNGATFLNASVQGAAQQVRNFREAKANGVKGMASLVARFALAAAPAAILNNLLWDDDEEYEHLADYIKEGYYIVGKTDNGQFIRIPKGRTMAVVQKIAEDFSKIATGDDLKDYETFTDLLVEDFKFLMDNVGPNNPIENNIFAPLVQAWKGKAWYGDDLIPSRLKDLPPAEQYDEGTDSFSIAIAQKLAGTPFEISPIKLNYLFNQYSGAIGDVLLPSLTPEAESGDDSEFGKLFAPLRDKFVVDPVLDADYQGDFFETQDMLRVNANSSNATDEDTLKYRYMQTIIGDLYDQKREIQNSSLSDSAKFRKIKELQNEINTRMDEALNSYNDVYIDGVYSEVGGKRFNYSAEDDTWYEIKPKNADGEDNYYYHQEQKVKEDLGIDSATYWNNREMYDDIEYFVKYVKEGEVQWDRRDTVKNVFGYDRFGEYADDLNNLKADEDDYGNKISGSRKKKVKEYVYNMDIPEVEKHILFKLQYNSDKKHNYEIIDYLNERSDINYDEMEAILLELGFEVDSEGNISW